MSKSFCKSILLIKLIFLSLGVIHLQANTDPLNSPMWEDVRKKFLNNEEFVFDNKNIIIKVPSFADNPLQVPIYVDASYYKNAKRLLIFADLNAIIPLVDMELLDFKPVISVNMKIAQGTPLRAALLDENGLWHVASANIKSFGGGCSVASEASALENWESQLGKSKYHTFKKDEVYRIKFSVFHPMDTGLFVGNPAFFIEKIIIKENNKIVAKIKTHASVSENPRFLLETQKGNGNYLITITDNDGNEFIINTSFKG